VLRSVDIVREHTAPCPAQSPSHAANSALPVGVAIKMTSAPGSNELQFAPQLDPAGLVVTVPPAPAMPAVRKLSRSRDGVEPPQPKSSGRKRLAPSAQQGAF